MSACRRHFVFAAGFSAAINLLYIAPTLYMLQVYDRVVPTSGVMTLLFLTLLLVVSLVALSLLELIRTRLLVRASARLNRELSGYILAANLNRRAGPVAQQAMRDFDVFRQVITGAGVVALFDAPWTFVYVGLCFVLNPILGAMAMFGSASLVGLSVATERATRGLLEQAANAASTSYASQARTASQRDIVNALGMRAAMVHRHLEERSSVTAQQSRASFSAGGYLAATRFIRLALQSLGLGVAAWLAVEHQISAGAIFAASLLMSRAFAPLEMVLGSWRSLTEARNAYGRLSVTLSAAVDETSPTVLPPPTGHVMVEQLWVAGPVADRPLLSGVSFAVRPGEVLGIVGPSGAGKTTLVRALVGALAPDRGAVRLDHASLRDWDTDRLGRYVGYLPQELGLFHGTVKQNICRFVDVLGLGGEATDAKVVAAAQLCGAHEMILRLPLGYDTMLDWGGGGLSLGQAQRVALARAFFDEPRVIILDEPNAHLDGEGEAALLQSLAKVKAGGAAVVLVAHRATMLPVMDSLLVLNGGRVSHLGTREEVLGQIGGAAHSPRKLATGREAA